MNTGLMSAVVFIYPLASCKASSSKCLINVSPRYRLAQARLCSRDKQPPDLSSLTQQRLSARSCKAPEYSGVGTSAWENREHNSSTTHPHPGPSQGLWAVYCYNLGLVETLELPPSTFKPFLTMAASIKTNQHTHKLPAPLPNHKSVLQTWKRKVVCCL